MALCVSKTSDTGLAHTWPREGAGMSPVEWGEAWLEKKLGAAGPGQPQNHCQFTAFSRPTCLTRFEKINRSVCLKVRLLVSSLVEGFATDFGCSYKL